MNLTERDKRWCAYAAYRERLDRINRLRQQNGKTPLARKSYHEFKKEQTS